MSVPNQDVGISAMYGKFRWNLDNVPSVLNKYSMKLRTIHGAPTGKETALHNSVILSKHDESVFDQVEAPVLDEADATT